MKKLFWSKKGKLITALVMTVLFASGVAAYAQDKLVYDPDKAYAKIDKSYEGILEYVDMVEIKNEELSSTEVEDVITTVTFSEEIDFSEIEDFITKYNIYPVQLQARGLMDDGTRITIFTRTDMGFEATKELLLKQAEEDGYEFMGLIGMNAVIDAQNIKDVESDKLTYLADTSADKFAKLNKEVSGQKRNNLKDGKLGGIFPQSLAWDLEDLGIIE